MKKTTLGIAMCAAAALALSLAGCSKNDECCGSSCKDGAQTKCCKSGEAAKCDGAKAKTGN